MDNETAAILEIEGKQFNLEPSRNYLVGRLAQPGQKLDIGLRSENVDAKHAVVIVHHDQIKLLDLYSNSGTFWNDQRLEGLKEVTLERSGTLQFGTVVASLKLCLLTEIPDNNDFNKSPKDSSTIICSSPKVASQTLGNSKKSQNDLTSGHEMCKQSGSQELSVPVRTPNVSNTSRHSLNIPCTQEMSLNGALGNKTADSFCIPETQCPVRVQLSVNSIAGNKSSDKGVDSMVNSNDDEDYDFSIPETQEVSAYSKNQIDKQLDYEKAVLDANLSQSILAEDDEKMIAGSQFRICTQDFNEASYSDADDSDDLLLRVPDFAMIPPVQQKPVMLGDTACQIATATEVKESQPKVTDSKENGAVADKEILAIQCSDQVTKSSEVIDERDEMCTPDLFDLPELAQLNAKEAYHDCSFTKSNENTDSSGHTAEVKEVDMSEKPSTSFKLPVQPSSVPLIKVTDPPLFEDHVDLLPTQVFTPKTVGQKKTADGGCSPEYLTLSDKENVKPTAAVMLAPFGDMEPTQTFSTSESNNSLRRTEAELLIPVEISTKTVVKTSSNAENMLPPVSIAEEDDFLPTQVFTARRVKSTDDNGGQPSASKSHGSASVPSNVERINDGETILARTDEHTPQTTTNVNLGKPTVSISKVISNANTAQSPDIDMLCTPQIIVENFKQAVSTTKRSIIGKQKVLFGDDSDEDSDSLELIAVPKVCHDFDKLLPHLTKKQMSPKREEVNAKMHLYNQAFTKLDKIQKNKRGDGNQIVVSRNRGERHEARDWKRDKIAETSIETVNRVRDKVSAKVPKTVKGSDVNAIQTVSKNEKMENDEATEMMSKNAKKKQDKVDDVIKNDRRKHDKVAKTVSKSDKRDDDNEDEPVSKNKQRKHDKEDETASKNDKRKHDKVAENLSKHGKVDETRSKNDKGEDDKTETVAKNNKRKNNEVDKSVSKNEQRKHDKADETVSNNDKRNPDKVDEAVSKHDKVKETESKNDKRKHDKVAKNLSKHDKVDETRSKNDKEEDDKVDKILSKNDKRKHYKVNETVHDKVNETESKNDQGKRDKVPETLSKNDNIEPKTNRTRSNTKASIKNVEHKKLGRKRNNSESTSETNAKLPRNVKDVLENSKKSKEHEVDKRKNDRSINKAEDEERGACDKITADGSTSRSTRSQSRLHSHSSTTDSSSSAFAKVTTRRMTRLQSHRIELETEAIETRTKATSNEAVGREQGRPRRCTTKNETGHHNKQRDLRQPKITYITLDSSDSSDDSSVNANNSIEATKGKNLRSLNSFNDSCSTKAVSSPKSTSNSSTHHSRHLKKLKVSMTMVDSEYFESLSKNSTGIWTITSDPTESDILIMDKSNRTFKFLVAMARGIPIVTSRWLECVNKKGTIVNMAEHFYTDEAFEKRHRFSLIKSIELARNQKIFANYDFLMTPDVRPLPHELKTIILCAGGSVHVDVPPIRCDQKLYLVSTKSDQKLWHRYRRLNSNIRIIRSEGVMMSVMRQSIKPLDSNLLA